MVGHAVLGVGVVGHAVGEVGRGVDGGGLANVRPGLWHEAVAVAVVGHAVLCVASVLAALVMPSVKLGHAFFGVGGVGHAVGEVGLGVDGVGHAVGEVGLGVDGGDLVGVQSGFRQLDRIDDGFRGGSWRGCLRRMTS